MIRNYIIVAWRNLWKHKLFSLINITGLTISISVALVVYLIIDFEYGFDKHHTEADRIFRVVSKSYFLGEEYHNPGVPIPLAQAVKDNISGIEEAAGFFQIHNYPVMIPTNGGNKILKQQQDAILTDPGYFKILKHSWLAGNAEAALREPFRVVLSESKAKSYFNIDDATLAIGRDIIYRDPFKR
jgi:hypothetical protein